MRRGIHELTRGTRTTWMTQEKREQEGETMNTNALCYCTPNLHKLVHHVPLGDGVPASIAVISQN